MKTFSLAAVAAMCALGAVAEGVEFDFTKGLPSGGRLRKGAALSAEGLVATDPTNRNLAAGFELDAPATPDWAFRFEAEFVPATDEPPRNGSILWDDLGVVYKTKDGYYGFQAVVRRNWKGKWEPIVYLGYGADLVQAVGPAADLKAGKPVTAAFEFRPDGTVRWEFAGETRVQELGRLGVLAASRRNPVLGDRAVCYYNPNVGTLRRVALKPLAFDRYLVRPVGRAAFVRGERDAKVTYEAIDLRTFVTNRATVAVETRLRPGWKDMKVTIGGREHPVRYGIGPHVADRMTLCMQNSNQEIAGPAQVGFTQGQYGDGKRRFVVDGIPSADDPQLAEVMRSLDEALVSGLDFSLGAKRPILLPPGVPASEFYRISRDGKTPVTYEQYGRTNIAYEVGDTRLLGYVRACWEKWGELLGGHPALTMALPYSEFRDRAVPSRGGDARRYKAETGRDMPAHYTYGRLVNGGVMHKAHPDGLVDDDDPLLHFYHWYWKDGDGWPRYVSAASDGIRAGVAKAGKKSFDTFWDPCVRCPPRWGSGGSVTRIGQWIYADPEPMSVAGPAEEVLAMAAGRPGQQAFIHTQLMCYRRKIAPPEVEVGNPPDWWRRYPRDMMFLATPADVFTEATWSMLAKPMAGYTFYPWGSLQETPDGYDPTDPRLRSAVTRLFREVMLPLGPMLKRLKRLEPDVAVFENFTSVVMSEPFGMGWHAAPVTFLQRARLDPKVVYEETLERDGFGGIKVLFAPACGFVTKSMAAKLRDFRAKGGILVADGRLAKALEADILVDEQRFAAPPAYDYPEDEEAQGIKSQAIVQNRRKTRTAKLKMCDDAEKLRRALAGRYAARSDSSSPDILVYNRRWQDVNYLFAVSDRRDFGDYVGQWGLLMEKGLPNEGWVSTKDEGVAAVYELSRGGKVAFTKADGKVKVPVRFDTCDGRLFAFLPQEIAAVEATAERKGDEISVTMKVVDAAGHPVKALLPVEIRVFASDGDEIDGAGFFAAEGGSVSVRVTTRLDDPKGPCKVVCRDRASGLEKTLQVGEVQRACNRSRDNRSYEFREADRTADDYPPLVDFETPDPAWRVETSNCVVAVERSAEQQCFGAKTLKVTYRAAGENPSFRLRPDRPLPVDAAADTLGAWMWFDHFGRGANKDPATPTVVVKAHFRDAADREVVLPFTRIDWRNWHLVWQKLPSGLKAFDGFSFTGGTQTDDRTFFVDNIAVFRERKDPLPFKPRARRNLTPLEGANAGLNTGAGRLPFPTREETSRPSGAEATPAADEPRVRFTGRAVAGAAPGKLRVTERRIGRTLVVDFYAPPGAVTELTAGLPSEAAVVGTYDIPYLVMDGGNRRMGVDLLAGGLFRFGFFDWYRSNASAIKVTRGEKGCAMSVVYKPDTDGRYNAFSERLFITLSPKLEEVLPTIANPVSPYRHVAGKKLWRVHAANDPDEDRRIWKLAHRYGFREVVICDHETQWRDGGESFTCRTKAAPGKGGDAWMTAYSKYLREELGYVYGPYNNFTDFAPANRNWSPDRVARTEDGSLAPAWMRCYACRPSWAPEACETFAPVLKRKFGFNTAYCDVHTAVAFWNRTDYDSRVAGAASASAVYYLWGETLLLQKKFWEGPVYSEGNHQMYFVGLTDGDYAQDWGYDFEEKPWIVDFDLRKMHDLSCCFGIGSVPMFSRPKTPLERTFYIPHAPTEADRERLVDRFVACTLAYGHTGFLVLDWWFSPYSKPFGRAYGPATEFRPDEGDGTFYAMRSYYMVQQAAARVTQAKAKDIRYFDAAGRGLDVSAALPAGVCARNQLAVSYDDGTYVAVNGSDASRLRTTVFGRDVDLPPNGYAVWTDDGSVNVELGDAKGTARKFDYAETPAYLFVDGRGTLSAGAKARSAGSAACRVEKGGWEIVPVRNVPCAFRIPGGRAVALDRDGKELGEATARAEDGWYAVDPVPGAFSYRVFHQ